MSGDLLPEPYQFKAKPGIYKGIPMRSMLEVRTAQTLDRIGIPWIYEPDRFADEDRFYTPDFRIPSILVKGWPGYKRTGFYLEARPRMDGPFRTMADKDAATLGLSKDDPLLFVGVEGMPYGLLGWCYGIHRDRKDAVPGVISRWSEINLDGLVTSSEPCLYIDAAASIWLDGFQTAQREAMRGLDHHS